MPRTCPDRDERAPPPLRFGDVSSVEECAMLTSLLLLATGLSAPIPSASSDWELSTGASELMYLSALSGGVSTAAEAAIEGPVHGPLRFAAGARLGFRPVAPELFARLLSCIALESWRPSAGVELGVSARADYESYDGLLGELRRASHRDLVPVYFAFVAAPLHFALSDHWRLNVLELHVGTHIAPLGRYVRLQLGLVSLGLVL
jgi:hypothetical protein